MSLTEATKQLHAKRG